MSRPLVPETLSSTEANAADMGVTEARCAHDDLMTRPPHARGTRANSEWLRAVGRDHGTQVRGGPCDVSGRRGNA